MISEDTVEAIRRTVRLVDLVSDSVDLKQRGGNFVGLCPFHGEKTPSFNIRDSDNRYHCFGCGVSGDVFTFVMETQGLSFPEAIEFLANRNGIEIKRVGGRQKKVEGPSKDQLYRVNAAALEFFRKALKDSGSEVKDYLAKRNLNADMVNQFSLGIAPVGWRNLSDWLRQKKVNEELILASGLAKRNSRGELYDTFRGRLIFPVWADSRRILGFGGRVLPFWEEDGDNKAPKYLNSPETPIYHKSSVLYGLPQALSALREKKEVYVVEGYMDVIGLMRVGIENVVATCGTAVTAQHTQRLSRFVRQVNILFDGDSAGRSAASKAFSTFLNSEVDVAAVFVPEGEDPDSVAATHGDQTGSYLESLEAVPLLNSYILQMVRDQNVEHVKELGAASKGKIVKHINDLLLKVENRVQRVELMKSAAHVLMVDRDSFDTGKKDSAVTAEMSTIEEVDEEEEPGFKPIDQLSRVDQTVLHIVMARRDKVTQEILKDPDLCRELDPLTVMFVSELDEVLTGSEDSSEELRKKRITDLLKSGGSTWVAHWREAYEMLSDPEIDFEKMLSECKAALHKLGLERIMGETEQQILEAEEGQDRDRLFQQKIELAKRLRGSAVTS